MAKHVIIKGIGDNAAYGGDAGFSEVRFFYVPEPATVYLVGFGALVLVTRRRKITIEGVTNVAKTVMIVICALGVALGGNAYAEFIGGPDFDTTDAVTATASTSLNWSIFHFEAWKACDGSGLDATGQLHGTTNYTDAWAPSSVSGQPPRPGTTDTDKYWIEFEFDRAYALTNLRVWNNLNFAYPSRQSRDVIIEYSTTGGTDPSEWTTLGNYTVPQQPISSPQPGIDLCDFGGVMAKHVIIKGIGDNAAYGGDAGFSEVRFFYVPEPATAALVALGALVLVRRRRSA
jgi:hypothetical protein